MVELLPKHFCIPYVVALRYAQSETNAYEEYVAAGNLTLIECALIYEPDKVTYNADFGAFAYQRINWIIMREAGLSGGHHKRWDRLKSLEDRNNAGVPFEETAGYTSSNLLEQQDFINEAISQLPKEWRYIFTLFASGMSTPQIAKMLTERGRKIGRKAIWLKIVKCRKILEQWVIRCYPDIYAQQKGRTQSAIAC